MSNSSIRFERGNFQVTRWCCTSAMCILCQGAGDLKKRIRIVQTDNVSKEWAEHVARGWSRRDFGAEVEPYDRNR